jgi:hypothetical protein
VNLSLFEGELAPGNYVARLEGEFDGAELNVEKAFSVTPGAEAPADKTDEGEGDDEGGCSVSAKADGSGRAWPATSLLLLLFAGTLLLARRARC